MVVTVPHKGGKGYSVYVIKSEKNRMAERQDYWKLRVKNAKREVAQLKAELLVAETKEKEVRAELEKLLKEEIPS